MVAPAAIPTLDPVSTHRLDSAPMKIAHVRERNAPAGAPWRLAAALDADGARWLDLEEARRALVAAQPGASPQQRPVPPADHDPRRTPRARPAGGRTGRPADGRRRRADGRIGPRLRAADPPAADLPRLLCLRAARRHDVEAPRHGIPEAWYRLPIFYFSNMSEIRGPDEPVWAPRGSVELDYELEVGRPDRHAGRATSRRSAARRRSAATSSSTTGRRATSSARRRRFASGRPRARTSRPPSVRGWSPPTSWPMPAAERATTWR